MLATPGHEVFTGRAQMLPNRQLSCVKKKGNETGCTVPAQLLLRIQASVAAGGKQLHELVQPLVHSTNGPAMQSLENTRKISVMLGFLE